MSCRRNRGITLCRAEAVTEKKQYKRNINGNGTEIKLEGKYKDEKTVNHIAACSGIVDCCRCGIIENSEGVIETAMFIGW